MTAEELLERYAAGERDFSGINLEGADLSGHELQGIILRGANLRKVDLRDSDLSGYLNTPNPMLPTDL
ncbi:pentapeptide repeat-containing protein [Acaryochloris sp. CCMEE 5410]|uniref:pentapeptide repeat-containing protein n=1 Tax=Acaryochloris sp. CCMEE 5410 TaxID=310037 RepID=UPI0002484BE4|nr:pentapeptide repeat-containing protein [Acaryochloris sp. CCMEE 5410]